MQQACPVPFDEGRLWKGEDGPELKKQLQKHFHNITKAMDCVGCEKCKLWGKLQILGACMLLPSVPCRVSSRGTHLAGMTKSMRWHMTVYNDSS